MKQTLVEEQGGFRPHRGCPDQLFSLVEILQNRGKKGTFCCFIDVKKAFDRVFRAGLWEKVADVGVKGKMWRVLNSIYRTVESCVKVKGDLTRVVCNRDRGKARVCTVPALVRTVHKWSGEGNQRTELGTSMRKDRDLAHCCTQMILF